MRERAFLAVWLTGAFSTSANWMLGLSVPVLVYQLTESTAWLGAAAVASNLPSFLGSPLGGVWADRYSKRLVLLFALVAQTSLVFMLYYVSNRPGLTVQALLSLAAAIGFASSVNLSAYQALVAEIVPERQLRPAYKLNAIQFNLSRAVGPAVAGFVLAGWGAPTAFLVNAVAHAPLAVALLLIRPRRLPRTSQSHISAEISAAARVTWQNPTLRIALMTVCITSGFGMSVQQLAKGLTERVYGVDDAGLGILVATIGLTAVLTSVGIAIIGDRFRGSLLVRLGLILYGIGLAFAGATTDFRTALVGFGITGFGHVLVNVSVTTALQANVPGPFRGRVTSLQMMGIILSMAFGAQLGGFLGELIGLQGVVTIYGGILVTYAGYAHFRLDGLRDLD